MFCDDNNDVIDFLSYFQMVKEKKAKFFKLILSIINQPSAVECLGMKKFHIFRKLEV